MFDNRMSVAHIPFRSDVQFRFPLPPLLYPIFSPSLSSFLPLRSFHFLLSFWPKTDSGHGGSGATAGRPFCMPRVPCHTRQQARKSNFHRETYYTPPSRVYRASSEAYTVQGEEGGRALSRGHIGSKKEKKASPLETLPHIVIGDWTKGAATHILLLFLRFREKYL